MAFLFAAYTIVWIAICAYLFLLHSQVRALRREVERQARAAEEKMKA